MDHRRITLALLILFGVLLPACEPAMAITAPTPRASIPATPRLDDWVCVDYGVAAEVWEDKDGNGHQDNGELPMPNVCIWTQTGTGYIMDTVKTKCDNSRNRADKDGQWRSNIIYGGCGRGEEASKFKAQCNGIYVVVYPPINYRVTTSDTISSCAGFVSFGLMRESAPAP
jgi:hypothetical protein